MRLPLSILALFAGLLGGPLAGQDVVVRGASAVAMPQSIDCNSPAFWRDGKLFWFGSHGSPWLSNGPDQFGPWETRAATVPSPDVSPKWIESVWAEDSGAVWAWYHAEPVNLIPGSTLTAPKIGATVSFDGGYTNQDLGFVLESGDPIDPTARNGFFAGGHGDFTVILDRSRTWFYFFFGNYGGAAETQGVCVARMAFADRFSPAGKVWKYCNGAWQEPGSGGRVTPIYPVRKRWQAADPDAFWGPSVHWNTYLNCYVMLLNHAAGTPGWSQEGVYVSFCPDLTRPETWTEPRKILDRFDFVDPGAYYPQVMGLEPGGTDRRAGQTARLYLNGVSKWEIDFTAPATAPAAVALSATPAEATVAVGEPAALNVVAMGQPPFTYQWFMNGVAMPQATSATYAIAAATADDAGTYSVIVANDLGATASNSVTLTVTIPVVAPPPPTATPAPEPPPTPPVTPVVPRPQAFLSNLSVLSMLAADRGEFTVGFALQSATPKPLLLRAVGPSLALFGLSNVAADPRIDVFDSAANLSASNDNWLAADAPAFAAAGAFALPVGSADAALVAAIPSGTGTARVKAPGGGMVLVEIYDPAPAAASKLHNLSARARVGAGNQALIAGFTLTGTGTKRLLIRALGPQLTAFGVAEALPNPTLEVFASGTTKLAENDDWDAATEPLFALAGAAPLPVGSRDAALVVTLAAGSGYTVAVRSADGASGEALLEIYELP